MSLKKPTLDKKDKAKAALDFAEKTATTPPKATGNQVPEGDTRLTANVSIKHHTKLKIAAANKRTTIGELLEDLIDKHL